MSKYFFFRRNPAITPSMSDAEKKTLDACLFYCRKSPDNEVSRKICDVRDCIYILKNNSGSDESQKFCFHILDGWMLKTRNENIKEAIKEVMFREYETNFKGVPAAYCLTNFQTYVEDNDAEYEQACCNQEYVNFVLNYHGVNNYDFINPICPFISD
jgi:translation elongation factor EF-1beta